jgi:hypothetical protein
MQTLSKSQKTRSLQQQGFILIRNILFAWSGLQLTAMACQAQPSMKEFLNSYQKPETRDQKPETRDQKPETRNQKPETRNQRPETNSY